MNTNKVPLSALHVLVGDDGAMISNDIKVVHLKRPRTKLHDAVLLVKRKISNIDVARADEWGWREPVVDTVIVDDDLSVILEKATTRFLGIGT